MWALLNGFVKNKDYIIELNKLREGNNEFTFTIDEAFLQSFDYSIIKEANIQVSLNLFKRGSLLELAFVFTGNVHCTCDVCSEPMQYPAKQPFNLIIKLTEESNFDDDEIIYLGKNEIEFDLTQFLYECMQLILPAKVSCEVSVEPKPCNPEVLEKLNFITSAEEDEENVTDPRWDKLKDIIKNN